MDVIFKVSLTSACLTDNDLNRNAKYKAKYLLLHFIELLSGDGGDSNQNHFCLKL